MFKRKEQNHLKQIVDLLQSSSTDVTTKIVLVAGLREFTTKWLKEIRPRKNSRVDPSDLDIFVTECDWLRSVITTLSEQLKRKYYKSVSMAGIGISKWSPNIYGDLFDECISTAQLLAAHVAQFDTLL